MARLLALLCMFSVVLGCASAPADSRRERYAVPTDAIVLRVEVVDVRFTDLHSGCGEVKSCIPFYFWWTYRAQVKEVVSGVWAEPEVEFMHLQHGKYIPAVTKDCYVVLRPAGEELQESVGLALVADKLLSRFFKADRPLIKALRAGA